MKSAKVKIQSAKGVSRQVLVSLKPNTSNLKPEQIKEVQKNK
jgi:hypothetical protein